MQNCILTGQFIKEHIEDLVLHVEVKKSSVAWRSHAFQHLNPAIPKADLIGAFFIVSYQ